MHGPSILIGMGIGLCWGFYAGAVLYFLYALTHAWGGYDVDGRPFFWIPLTIGGCLGVWFGRYLATPLKSDGGKKWKWKKADDIGRDIL